MTDSIYKIWCKCEVCNRNQRTNEQRKNFVPCIRMQPIYTNQTYSHAELLRKYETKGDNMYKFNIACNICVNGRKNANWQVISFDEVMKIMLISPNKYSPSGTQEPESTSSSNNRFSDLDFAAE